MVQTTGWKRSFLAHSPRQRAVFEKPGFDARKQCYFRPPELRFALSAYPRLRKIGKSNSSHNARTLLEIIMQLSDRGRSVERYIPLHGEGRQISCKLLIRFGVPINDFFEHLSATIAEATPFYELCAIVLDL
jgi:hypothetical protein